MAKTIQEIVHDMHLLLSAVDLCLKESRPTTHPVAALQARNQELEKLAKAANNIVAQDVSERVAYFLKRISAAKSPDVAKLDADLLRNQLNRIMTLESSEGESIVSWLLSLFKK